MLNTTRFHEARFIPICKRRLLLLNEKRLKTLTTSFVIEIRTLFQLKITQQDALLFCKIFDINPSVQCMFYFAALCFCNLAIFALVLYIIDPLL